MSRSSIDASRTCLGPSRRSLLRAGVLTAFGLGLGDLFRFQSQSLAAGPGGSKPTKVKHCILIWMAGGPSHIDTFDPKPDAPVDVKGEFKPIDTAVPGLKISEVFPNLAKMMDRVTLIRSVTSPEADHDRAAHHLLTGYRPNPSVVYPSFGSVVSKTLENIRGVLPPYIAMPDAPIFASSGYLSPAFDPFAVGGDANADGFRVQNLTPPDQVTLDRLNRRRGMVKRLDGFDRDVAPTPIVNSRDQFADRAYDLLTSSKAQAAFRIGDETAEMRQAYGRNPFGQSCLLARRLIQAGVSFVTINNRGPGALQWDTHQQNFPTIKNNLAPPLDLGLSTLLEDLKRLGLLDETLVIAMGEFGRTPTINPTAGRDHHGRANSALLAGAGIPKGAVIGKTDSKGDSPVDRPITPADLAATLYTALGIDPNYAFETPDGRPVRLVEGGKVLPELIRA
jgi:hypothetical protein